jgi:hypothetical protein
VASLLNASFHEKAGNNICQEPEFCVRPLTSQEVAGIVNAALASEDRVIMLELAYILDQYNNVIHEIEWP